MWEVNAGKGARAEIIRAMGGFVGSLIPFAIARYVLLGLLGLLLLLLLLLASLIEHLLEELELGRC